MLETLHMNGRCPLTDGFKSCPSTWLECLLEFEGKERQTWCPGDLDVSIMSGCSRLGGWPVGGGHAQLSMQMSRGPAAASPQGSGTWVITG